VKYLHLLIRSVGFAVAAATLSFAAAPLASAHEPPDVRSGTLYLKSSPGAEALRVATTVADTRPLARLTVREGRRAEELIVLEGAGGRNLAFGPAHDPASVMPGEPGNSVIERHRDTHFAVLRGIKTGDTLRVETLTRRDVDFVVTNITIVDSRRARIALRAERPRLTLVTCYPFDAPVPGGPLRLVVTADAIHYINAHQ